ncbi:hypothetical protein Tco_1449165 [Tanacetum coccineum]
MFDNISLAIHDLRKRIDVTLLEDRQRRWMSDIQNSLREFYKTDVISMSDSLSINLKELQQELIDEVQEMMNIFESMEQKVAEKSPKENILQNEIDRLLEVSLTSEIRYYVLISIEKQKNKMLRNELEKSSSDSKDIQANLLKKIKILENDFKRSQAQSINFELKLQHKKEKIACDVSWKSRLSTLNDENVVLKTQVDSVNQDLLIIISELKNKLKTINKGKNVNTKFDKSETSGTLLCVTPLPKNIAVKAPKVSNTKVNADRSNPVTSHSIPKNEQSQKQNANVIARGMYRITKTETQTPDSKTNMIVSNSRGVESSNSIRRPQSKDTKSKERVLKNTSDKRSFAHVQKMSSSVSIYSNKRETMHSNVWSYLKDFAGLPNSGHSIDDILDDIILFAKRKTLKSIIAKLVVAMTEYFIWQERNSRLFKNVRRMVTQVIDCIMNSVRLKLLSCHLKKTKGALELIHVWKLSDAIFTL